MLESEKWKKNIEMQEEKGKKEKSNGSKKRREKKEGKKERLNGKMEWYEKPERETKR